RRCSLAVGRDTRARNASSVPVSDSPPISAASMVARAVSPTSAATSTRLASTMAQSTALTAPPASNDGSADAELFAHHRRRYRAYACGFYQRNGEAARMLTHVIETATPGLIVLLAVSLVIAGMVKGTIGVGMPTVAFPLLSMF